MTQKLRISGKPGTDIYSQDMKRIAYISKNGYATIKISRDDYHYIFISHEYESDKYVPFALNFKKRSFGNNQKAALAIIAYPIFCYAWVCQSNQSYDHFKYLPEQTTNQDIVFTPLKQTADYKTLDKSPYNASQQKANTERRKFNSGGSQSNKDQMSVIIGTYSGKGELLDGSDVIEEYTDLSIVIKKKSENTVSVEVLASDGYSYFDEEMIYSVNRQDNQYVLKQKGSNSRIVIKNGNLSYTNHNINDGETVFTLMITADK